MYTPREHRHGNILLLLLLTFTAVGVVLTADPETGTRLLESVRI
ncbi:MAG: hypothetical protein SV253_04090 [Halobacteria archaeon]|nr:hypothetical protein [Halobacteria archaeon]